jgi:hypothetical protein
LRLEGRTRTLRGPFPDLSTASTITCKSVVELLPQGFTSYSEVLPYRYRSATSLV